MILQKLRILIIEREIKVYNARVLKISTILFSKPNANWGFPYLFQGKYIELGVVYFREGYDDGYVTY